MRPARGALTVDPGETGGVAILGWDKDSIAVTAEIEVQGYSDAEAADLARQVRIDASGSTIRATGPGPSGRSQHWSPTHRSDRKSTPLNSSHQIISYAV